MTSWLIWTWSRQGYGLVTLHRPSNVDDPDGLSKLVSTLEGIAGRIPLVFPVHPRTRQRIGADRLAAASAQLHMIDPVSYLDFLALEQSARFVISDSGGVQEETTYLHVPCLTIRPNTERPITISMGTNELIGGDLDRLRDAVDAILAGHGKLGQIPPLWDGRAGERIAEIVVSFAGKHVTQAG